MKNDIFSKDHSHLVLEAATIGNLIFSIGASSINDNFIASFSRSCSILNNVPEFNFTVRDAKKYLDILNSDLSLEDKESITPIFESEDSFYQMMFAIDDFINTTEPDYIWTSQPQELGKLLGNVLPQSRTFMYFDKGLVMDTSTFLSGRTHIDEAQLDKLNDVTMINPLNKALLESQILINFISNINKVERNMAVHSVKINNSINKAKELLSKGDMNVVV